MDSQSINFEILHYWRLNIKIFAQNEEPFWLMIHELWLINYESIAMTEIQQDTNNNVFTKNALQYNTVILQGWVEYS